MPILKISSKLYEYNFSNGRRIYSYTNNKENASLVLTVKLDEASFPGILMVQDKTKFRILYYGNRSNLDLDKPHCNIEPVSKIMVH